MKKKRLSRGAGAAIMAAVYLLVLVLGSAAITEYPLRKQRRALFRFADSYAGALAEPDAEIPYISPRSISSASARTVSSAVCGSPRRGSVPAPTPR